MSSFQLILLSIFGSAAVAGILIFSFLMSSNSASDIGDVVVWGTFDEGAFATVLRRLMDEDARLKTVRYVQKQPESFETELTNALASGTGPDIFIMPQEYAVVDEPKIATIPYEVLTAEQFKSLFVEGSETLLREEGSLGIPFVVDPLILFWNREMLSAGGIARPPVLWPELFAISRAVTKRDDSGSIIKSAVALGEFANINHAKTIFAMLVMQAGGTMTSRDTAGQLKPSLISRTSDTSRPAEEATAFYTSFSNPSNDYYSWNRSMQDSRASFAAGDTALYVGLASEMPLMRSLNPNLNFSVAPVPQVRDGGRTLTGGRVYALAIPRTSQNLQGALTVAFLLSSSQAAQSFATAFGMAPAHRAALSEPAQGTEAMVNKQAIIVRTWEDPQPIRTDEIFQDMIESVTSGAASLQAALQRAEEAMREEIGTVI